MKCAWCGKEVADDELVESNSYMNGNEIYKICNECKVAEFQHKCIKCGEELDEYSIFRGMCLACYQVVKAEEEQEKEEAEQSDYDSDELSATPQVFSVEDFDDMLMHKPIDVDRSVDTDAAKLYEDYSFEELKFKHEMPNNSNDVRTFIESLTEDQKGRFLARLYALNKSMEYNCNNGFEILNRNADVTEIDTIAKHHFGDVVALNKDVTDKSKMVRTKFVRNYTGDEEDVIARSGSISLVKYV